MGIADGFARVCNGRPPGVFAMQFGPGVENAVPGIATAFSDSSPMLLLPMGHLRERDGIPPIFGAVRALGSVTKSAEQINVPERTVNAMRRAFKALKTPTPPCANSVASGVDELTAQGYTADIQISRTMEMRYLGQNYELELPLDLTEFDEATTARLWDSFHELHASRFGFNAPNSIIEVVNFLVTVMSVTGKPDLPILATSAAPPRPAGHRRVVYETGSHDAPVFKPRRPVGCAANRWASDHRRTGLDDCHSAGPTR